MPNLCRRKRRSAGSAATASYRRGTEEAKKSAMRVTERATPVAAVLAALATLACCMLRDRETPTLCGSWLRFRFVQFAHTCLVYAVQNERSETGLKDSPPLESAATIAIVHHHLTDR